MTSPPSAPSTPSGRPSFNWPDAIAELERRDRSAAELGGRERIERRHKAGRLTIRERIGLLATDFEEIGGHARFTELDANGDIIDDLPSSYVCGLGTINERWVAVGGEDFTVRAGAPQATYLDRVKGGLGGFVEDLAMEYRIPLLLFMEGIGGDVGAIDGQGHSVLVSSYSWKRCYDLMSMVPVITAVLGAAAGGTGGRAVLSHFSVISKGSVIFAGGPPVVRRSLGLDVDKHELGGAENVATTSGTIDNLAEDEDDAIAQMKQVLSYLPQNVWEMPPRGVRTDPVDRRDDDLLNVVPENRRRPYPVRRIIDGVVDRDSFFEIGATWGRSVMTGLSRIDGIPCGIIASNPNFLAGAIDGQAADKQVRFVDLCSTFHLPIVYFVDVPGFMVGPAAEREGVLRKGMRAIQATIEAEVPIITVHIRKAFGMAVGATSNPDALGLRLAWPSVEWGDMPVEGGVEAGFRRQIESSPDPKAYRLEIEQRLLAASDPWRTVEAFGVERMIDPRDTRRIVATFLNASLTKLATTLGPAKRTFTPRP